MSDRFRTGDWRRSGHGIVVLLSLMLGVVGAASAGDITYNVNLQIGATGSVTGDIVTDGALGTLVLSNILGCDLTLNDGTDPPANLVCGSNAVAELAGDALSATASELFYNFGDLIDNYFFVENDGGTFPDGPGVAYACFVSGFSHCYGSAGESFVVSNFQNDGANSFQATSLGGTQVIAGSSAPEPSTLALLSALIALLGLRRSITSCVRG